MEISTSKTCGELHLWCFFATNRKASSTNRKASSENRKVFSKEAEGFFGRVLCLYTYKFPKCGAASLTYLLQSRLGLPHSRSGLLHLCLSWNSRPAMEGFLNRSVNFKDAYHTVPVRQYTDSPYMGRVVSVYQTLLPLYTRWLVW